MFSLRKLGFVLCLLTSFLTISLTTFAQKGKISGRLVDQSNHAVVGAAITIVGASQVTLSDVDGKFLLSVDSGRYTVEISSVGFETKRISDIDVKNNVETPLEVSLVAGSNKLNNVTVTTSLRRETTNALISFQKNTNSVAQVLSAEAIRRSPDRNTAEALKRVTGLSLQEGRYLIIRGLSDRYNQAMLNGVLLSSTEPDRKTFSFDIFPSAVVENIIVNKTFIPEFSGEWAGGLVQINTKDIPARGFLNVQVGVNANTNTIGKDFYTYKGGKLDWLGIDDGARALPGSFPLKNAFASIPYDQKITYGQQLAAGSWAAEQKNGLNTLGSSFLINGGFNKTIFKKQLGGTFALTYLRSVRNTDFTNQFFTINDTKADPTFSYNNNRYNQEILWGALANFSLKLNAKNKISLKNLFNINSSDYTTLRNGVDYDFGADGTRVKATELGFRNITFFNTVLSGEHFITPLSSKFTWFGGFTVLDQYIPGQRRLQYNQTDTAINAPYQALLSNTLSQKSGSLYYSNLNDYIYNAGGDITTNFNLFSQKQSVKGGYNLQIKDRLFNARPFAITLPSNNPTLLSLNESQIFNAANFGAADNQFHFDENPGIYFRYLANTILNAGYVQFDNNFASWLRVVWGARYEYFDQLVGSTRKSDPRFSYSKRGDLLPALNITFKVKNNSNLRVAASQTLVRPEFRELTGLAFYDFEIGATIIGNPNLVRTKVTNLDVRYELYPKAGELFTLGAFYKKFNNPIELAFNQSGVGSSTFNFVDNGNLTANTFGAEFEFRKKLDFINGLSPVTAFGNFSYIYNRVKFGNTSLNRPMQGQSPYLINAGLQYDAEKSGLSATVLFNQVGRRILYVGNDQLPPVWEAPRPLLDLQLAKKVIKSKGEIKLNVSDIINQKARFYHDLNDNKKYSGSTDALALVRRYGTNVSLTFSYTIR